MVRILNFFCVALMGFSILALYHVSEKTRVTHMQLPMRDDVVTDGGRRDAILANAPQATESFFTVPKVVE